MARYEVTDPDGKRYEVTAPDNATESELRSYVQAQTGSGPKPPKEEPPPTWGEIGHQFGHGALKGATEATTGLFYRLPDWFGEKTGLYDLPNVEDTETYKNLTTVAEPETQAGRYAQRIGEFLGGSAPFGFGLGGLARGAVALAPQMQFARSLARVPWRGVAGTEAGAALGGGGLSQAAEEQNMGPLAQAAAGIVGGFGGAVGTQRALKALGAMGEAGALRLPGGQQPQPLIPGASRPPPAGSPPGTPPIEFIPGESKWRADLPAPLPPQAGIAAGEYTPEEWQVVLNTVANRMQNMGASPETVQNYLARLDAAHSPFQQSHVPRATMPIDMSPELAREAGTQMRMYQGASRLGESRLATRQTGETPALGLDPQSGLTHYAPGADELLALRTGVGDLPKAASQQQRFLEGLNRFTLTQDMPHHGYGETAEQTARAIAAKQAEQSDIGYGQLRTMGDKVDLQKNKGIQKVVDNLDMLSKDKSKGATRQGAIVDVLDEMAPRGADGVRRVASHIDDLDKAKQTVNEAIEKLRVTEGNTPRLKMNEMRDVRSAILEAVETKTGDLGTKYAQVRGLHADEAELLSQLRLGEDLRAGKAPIEDYLAYAKDPKAQSRIRHGFTGAIARELSAASGNKDVSTLFATAAQKRMMRGILDNTPQRGERHADKFFEFHSAIGSEKVSRQVAYGGSQTAKNIQEDKVAGALHTLRDVAMTPGVGGKTAAAARFIAESAFGKGSNVAKGIVDMLTSADITRNREAMRQVLMVMGRNRFRQAIDRLELGFSRHGQKTIGTAPGAEAAREREY